METTCEHEVKEITITLDAGIRKVEKVCTQCDFVLASGAPREPFEDLVQRITVGDTEWRVTIERLP